MSGAESGNSEICSMCGGDGRVVVGQEKYKFHGLFHFGRGSVRHLETSSPITEICPKCTGKSESEVERVAKLIEAKRAFDAWLLKPR